MRPSVTCLNEHIQVLKVKFTSKFVAQSIRIYAESYPIDYEDVKMNISLIKTGCEIHLKFQLADILKVQIKGVLIDLEFSSYKNNSLEE